MKLFIVQYSQETDKFQLTEVNNPEELPNFEIPIIDAPYQSTIVLSSYMVGVEETKCSFPNSQVFQNPHNKPVPSYRYGLLYNGFAVQHPNFAPPGWHVPNNDDWILLQRVVSENTGGLKETGFEYWDEPNLGATNSFHFSGRGAGYRFRNDGFSQLRQSAYFWSNTAYTNNWSYWFKLSYDNADLYQRYSPDDVSLSVRLIKDDFDNPGSLEDADGNIYQTVTIGAQVWLARNWQCTKFNDGSDIPNITGFHDWENDPQPSYWAYNNDLTLV